jgi:hypothetical protein
MLGGQECEEDQTRRDRGKYVSYLSSRAPSALSETVGGVRVHDSPIRRLAVWGGIRTRNHARKPNSWRKVHTLKPAYSWE